MLTALGAFLRFWRLDYQAYWTDEAYTINRIRGSYAFLLEQLSDQGFPPGWYTLLRGWRMFLERFMSAGDTYLPWCLRAVPAVCGTLTVPALYFLARQFTDRRGALLVMLLAAVNPFLIYYARDIKMYAGLWLLVTLNMGLFFRWQTTRRHLLWFPLFVLSGVAMTATHSMAWAIVGLQLIFVLTRPRPKAWDAPLWVAGVGAMALLPVYWYFEYVQPKRWAGRLASDVDKGMFWIGDYTDMSWQTLAGLPTSHILGYLWPVYPPNERIDHWFLLGGADFTNHLAQRSWAWMARGELWAAVAVLAILLLGLIPWRGRGGGIRRGAEREGSVTRGRWWWVALWIALPTAALAATWIPTREDLEQDLAAVRIRRPARCRTWSWRGGTWRHRPPLTLRRRARAAALAEKEQAVREFDGEVAALTAQIKSNWSGRVWAPNRPSRCGSRGIWG